MKHLYTSIIDCTTQAAATPSACAVQRRNLWEQENCENDLQKKNASANKSDLGMLFWQHRMCTVELTFPLQLSSLLISKRLLKENYIIMHKKGAIDKSDNNNSHKLKQMNCKILLSSVIIYYICKIVMWSWKKMQLASLSHMWRYVSLQKHKLGWV